MRETRLLEGHRNLRSLERYHVDRDDEYFQKYRQYCCSCAG